MKQAPYFIPCTKIKFKALKQRHETVTFIEENIVETLPGISLKKTPKNNFLEKRVETQTIKQNYSHGITLS